MYSTAKLLSIFCVILAVANVVAALMLLLYFTRSNLGFTTVFTAIMYLLSATGILTLLTTALRSLCQDLQSEFDSTSEQIHELKKEIDSLEKKLENM